MDAYRQTDDIGNEDNPTVAVGTVGFFFPFQNEPEHQGGEKTGVGVYLAFHSGKPEGVAERVDEGARHAAGLCLYHLGRGIGGSAQGKASHQSGDGPEEKQDAAGAEQCGEEVGVEGHFRWVAGQLTEQIGREHVEGGARRMAYLQLIAAGDEFGTVPQTGCGLYSEAVGHGGNGKYEPAAQGVDSGKCFLLYHAALHFCCKSSMRAATETKKIPYICLTFVLHPDCQHFARLL